MTSFCTILQITFSFSSFSSIILRNDFRKLMNSIGGLLNSVFGPLGPDVYWKKKYTYKFDSTSDFVAWFQSHSDQVFNTTEILGNILELKWDNSHQLSWYQIQAGTQSELKVAGLISFYWPVAPPKTQRMEGKPVINRAKDYNAVCHFLHRF